MNEETPAAAFNREGTAAFQDEATEEDTSADSQSEDENQDEGTQSDEGDENTHSAKDTPFHQHPRWKQREEEWNTRFNEQEMRHTDDLKAIREEFGTARKENAAATQIPKWFGGTQEQWDAYRADRDAELKSAADGAVERLNKERQDSQKTEEKAVADATAYLRTEITSIEGDKTLNPTGAKITQATAEKLLKTVLENELIDSKGRWNYRAGWKLMQGAAAAKPVTKPNTAEKKDIASASTSDTRGGKDTNASAIATSDTFKKNRPW